MAGILTKLAFRNLWRQRRRTILTCLALAFGIYMVIILDSFVGGMTEMAGRNIVQLQTGDVQIQAHAYVDDPTDRSLDHVFAYSDFTDDLRQLDQVSAMTPRLSFAAELHNGMDDYHVRAMGVDPLTDPDVFTTQQYLAGQWLEPGQQQVVVGARVAQLLDLTVSDYVILLTRTANNAFQALDLEVVGILDTPHPEVNLAVYVPLDMAQTSLGLDQAITSLHMTVSGSAKSAYEAISSVVEQQNSTALGAYTWEQAAEDFMVMAQSSRAIHSMLLSMLILIAIVGVVNAILLGAMERTREIGVLKAMGMSEREVTQEFVTEAFGIGFVGSAAGVLLALLTNWFLVEYGINPYGDMDLGAGIPLRGHLYGVWNWTIIAGAFMVGILASVLAGIVPAIRAAGKSPIWALRQ